MNTFMSQHDSRDLLKYLLLAELDQARAELDSLRASIRYRLGDLILQGVPLSWRSVRILPRIFSLYRTYRRNGAGRVAVRRFVSQVPPGALTSQKFLLSRTSGKTAEDIWYTADAVELSSRLDIGPVTQLTLRFVTESIARRLGRLKMQGCHIIWWPEVEQTDSPLESYVRALADEHRVGGGD